MVESIKELKKICYRPKKETGMVLAYRKVSFYFTKLLLYTPISANQVSIISMFIGLAASFLLIFNNIILDILAVIMFYMWFMGDFCDGEIARYRGTAGSGIGSFLDWLNVYSVPPILFLFLSLRLYYQFLDLHILLLGLSASFFWFLSYTFVHLKDILRMILRTKYHVTKRIETSLSKKHSKTAFKLISTINKIFRNSFIIKRLVKKDKIPKIPKYEKVKRKGMFVKIIWGAFAFFHEVLENYYLPVYISIIVILEIILVYFYGISSNFFYFFLVFFAFSSPILWALKQILSKLI